VDLFETDSRDKWEKIQAGKRAGVVVPLFSVYSKDSLGIGELNDLKLLIDWCAKTGNSILQLLPMNEVGPIFCPYDSVSSFALEPMYFSSNSIPSAKQESFKDRIAELKKSFPTGEAHVDYRIKEEKLRLLWDIFQGVSLIESKEWQDFIEQNVYWLEDLSLFNVLKFHQQELAWYDWEERYRLRQPCALEEFCKEHSKEILFQKWVQWQLYEQFKDVKGYAESKNILIKGDLPILVSKDSADVWAHPEFFKLDFVAGAPPDMYCAKGQRWGTPTYNWEKIFADDGKYLREKLKYAQNFYDILRIDHVVGLFRIWSIPANDPSENQGLNGSFDPKEEKKWEGHGREILNFILNNTKMLLCAEDLGVIPPVCPKVLKELGIPGNDVQRWTKEWKTRHDFSSPKEYRFLSVAMLSTHDTTNWPAWWENEAGTIDEGLFIRKCSDNRKIGYERVKDKLFDAALSRHGRLRWRDLISSTEILVSILGKKKEELLDFIDLYQNSYREKEVLWKQLKLSGKMRQKSDKEIVAAVTKNILESNALFCINLIVDWLYLTDIFIGDPYQDRINVPGTVKPENWSLVLPLSLEQLLENKVCSKIREMVTASARTAV
jgi:4-alpha-glucanotransferase